MPSAVFSVSVSVDTSGLDKLIGKSAPTAGLVLKQHAYEFEAMAKSLAPVDLGALVNSIHVAELSQTKATIQDGVEYGIYQEFGVNHPYAINSPVLIKGRWVYIKTHPGFKAHPFFTPAAEKVGSTFFVNFFPYLLQGI